MFSKLLVHIVSLGQISSSKIICNMIVSIREGTAGKASKITGKITFNQMLRYDYTVYVNC